MGTHVKTSDLGSTTDVAGLLGLSPMTASKRRQRSRDGWAIWWPAPVAVVSGGELYDLAAVRAEAVVRGMHPARLAPSRGPRVDVDDLAGVGDLAELLEVEGGHVHSLTSRRASNGFPDHVAETGRGLLFLRSEVAAWAEDWNGRPQRGQARRILGVG